MFSVILLKRRHYTDVYYRHLKCQPVLVQELSARSPMYQENQEVGRWYVDGPQLGLRVALVHAFRQTYMYMDVFHTSPLENISHL